VQDSINWSSGKYEEWNIVCQENLHF
jgi:hypothetical protein